MDSVVSIRNRYLYKYNINMQLLIICIINRLKNSINSHSRIGKPIITLKFLAKYNTNILLLSSFLQLLKYLYYFTKPVKFNIEFATTMFPKRITLCLNYTMKLDSNSHSINKTSSRRYQYYTILDKINTH